MKLKKFTKLHDELAQERSYAFWDKAAWVMTVFIVLAACIFAVGSMPLIIANHKAVPLWKW